MLLFIFLLCLHVEFSENDLDDETAEVKIKKGRKHTIEDGRTFFSASPFQQPIQIIEAGN